MAWRAATAAHRYNNNGLQKTVETVHPLKAKRGIRRPAASPALCGTDERPRVLWLNARDPLGLAMAPLVWLLMLSLDAAVCFIVVEGGSGSSGRGNYVSWGTVAGCNALVVVTLASHVRTMTTDPGAVPRAARPLSSTGLLENICSRCDAYKPPNSHHCRTCGRCVARMDHHVSPPPHTQKKHTHTHTHTKHSRYDVP